MYPTLFQLAGPAMVGWGLMIFLPTLRATRFVAGITVFPVYLSVLYLLGIIPLAVAAGPGIMADFGSVDGVLGLLSDPDVALIAWIHILAFDHLLGVLIYRDNPAHRFVPFPVLSVVLFFTLMLGPVGFPAWWGIRGWRIRRGEEGPTGALGLDPESSPGRAAA